ncbi:hypothetical protein SAMN05444166_4183 [Singulisphaera sp. GP187]|uniref:hypothetical protein n=1 Tax=Singulisphaera sp. GP187 TaxID=1882752 RepID=UPI000925E598|nr:hypothetical protein [Singulisphaera sp. GP187]SIO37319.1 hypothetical protein SAMN05444166_4183 [Singulisphaera sp. GP187]
MSVMTNLYRGKVQRFRVDYRGNRYYVVASNASSAVAQVYRKLVPAEAARSQQTDYIPNESLTSLRAFDQVAIAQPSLRY